MNTQPVDELAFGWKEAFAQIPPAFAAYEHAADELNTAESAYKAEAKPQPKGLILQLRGQSYSMNQAHENLQAEWAEWSEHHQALRKRFGIPAKEEAYEAAFAHFLNAIREAMSNPSPDLSALRWKLEHVLDETPGASLETCDSLDVLRADMARLMGDAA